MASRPLPRGWALREKRTQHSEMPMLLLPAQALAARPALVRRSPFDHAAGGGCSAASPAHCQGLRWPCIALITAARAQQQSVRQESHFSTSANAGRAQTACKQPNTEREAQDTRIQGTV